MPLQHWSELHEAARVNNVERAERLLEGASSSEALEWMVAARDQVRRSLSFFPFFFSFVVLSLSLSGLRALFFWVSFLSFSVLWVGQVLFNGHVGRA